jgi:hypothetical protein
MVSRCCKVKYICFCFLLCVFNRHGFYSHAIHFIRIVMWCTEAMDSFYKNARLSLKLRSYYFSKHIW